MTRGRLKQAIGALTLLGLMSLHAVADEPRTYYRAANRQVAQETQPPEQQKPESTESTAGSNVVSTDCSTCDSGEPNWLMQHLGGLGGTGINVSGWLEQGFTFNGDSPRNRFNFPTTFNDRANEYQLNQFYMVFEKAVNSDGCCWDFGGRVDLMWGSDYYFTQATGLELEQDGTQKWNSEDGPRFQFGSAELYGIAMPQIYAEIYAPIGNGVTFKVGHFYTLIGYEVVTAPDNFFYSHATTMQYGEPFTHTGALASTSINDQIEVTGGITLGSDNFTNPDDTISFLGSFTWTSWDEATSLTYAIHTGHESRELNRYVQSIVLQQQLSDCLQLILQSDLGLEEEATPFTGDDAEWYGLNTYLIYEINECLSAGMRAEWFRDDDHARILPFGPFADGGNYYNLTMGLNVKPFDNLMIRPELRVDWSDTDLRQLGSVGAYDDFSDKNQVTAGVDVILTF